MKILFTHNAYQHRGGEDAVVEAEIALLRDRGHEVEVYQQHNDALKDMPRATAAITTIWSSRAADDVTALCRRFAPDVIHSHNTFPLISPSLYWTAQRLGVPVVQTLHNFRLLCPQAMFLREGRICEDCVGKTPWRAVTRKCYRESAMQSAVLSGMLTTHRALGTYRDRVTLYIALSEFARRKYIEGGLPADRFRVKPNFVEAAEPDMRVPREGGLYVGRLSAEKGIDVLAAAMTKLERPTIAVIGDGPMKDIAQRAFGDRYLGYRPLDEIMQRLQRAQYLVVPSICYENMPRTIIEAFASGVPVLCSRLGPLADIVSEGRTGLLFNSGDAADLAEKIAWANAHPEDMARMGRQAREEYLNKYTPESNHRMLTAIYKEAIDMIKGERHAA